MAESVRASWKPIAGVAALAATLGVVVWFMFQKTIAASGEQDVEIGLLCAACGHAFGTTYEKMGTLVAQARAKSYPHIWEGMRGPMTVCPSCGKPAVFRSRPCPKCATPVLFQANEYGGKVLVPECKACGWSAAK